MRGLALIVTAEERKETETLNIDDSRFQITDTLRDANDLETDSLSQSSEAQDSEDEPTKNENLQSLPPSSSGRRRWAPKRY